MPTLLGKIPVSQANEELVSAFRRTEWEETKKILRSYLNFCLRAQVHASIIVTETEQIHNGIIDLVNQHGIRKLVMGSTPDHCFNFKLKASSKATYAAKKAPPFCEIWFVSKGRHVWTREAEERTEASFFSVFSPDETVLRDRFRDRTEGYNSEVAMSTTDTSIMCNTNPLYSQDSTSPLSTGSWLNSPVDVGLPTEIDFKDEVEPEDLDGQLQEVMMEVEKYKKAAFAELVKRKELESEAAEAINRVQASEAACALEIKVREEIEGQLSTAKMQHGELVNQRDDAMRELQNVMKTISNLDARAQDVARRRNEAAEELELVQQSIAILRFGKQKFQQQEEEAVGQFEQWRVRNYPKSPNRNQFISFDESYDFKEFTLSELETATCGFSESFKLGQGGYGCIYKGEILNRSVAIKKLHPHYVQGQLEFQQEVDVFGKLRHPHLVTLIGACSEALALVYEYLPNGTLQDCLFSRTTIPSLTWQVRTRIAAEISSALLFLHSIKPEKVMHGDLKLKNIFLDSNCHCKIGYFGICRLMAEDAVQYPLFRRNMDPEDVFPYADLEHRRTEESTSKSDIYSFGIIVLQLLTGRPPLGLTNEVRRAMLSGKLSSILDPTAGEWPSDVAGRLAEFGLQCSDLNSRDRPELTPEVVRELEQLHLMKERPVPPFLLCPILQEIMHDPVVAADGFTYEERALRGWLENGRETSPMTNLKLKHLHLTPNHALRAAIQDWLCYPCRSTP